MDFSATEDASVRKLQHQLIAKRSTIAPAHARRLVSGLCLMYLFHFAQRADTAIVSRPQLAGKAAGLFALDLDLWLLIRPARTGWSIVQ